LEDMRVQSEFLLIVDGFIGYYVKRSGVGRTRYLPKFLGIYTCLSPHS